MFTGIIQAVGRIGVAQAREGDLRLRIEAGALDLSDAQLGESIAVSGVCLTVVAFDVAGFSADVSTESLALTTLGRLGEGAAVTLERARRAGDRLGGTADGAEVNLEVDVIARYVERLAATAPAEGDAP